MGCELNFDDDCSGYGVFKVVRGGRKNWLRWLEMVVGGGYGGLLWWR
jgi:hypothetical protein